MFGRSLFNLVTQLPRGALLLALLWLPTAPAGANAAAPVEVVGLFDGRAVLRIPGAGEKLLKVGQEKAGVTLLAADAHSARIRFGGEIFKLTLSSRIAGNFRVPERSQITVNADELGQYQVRGAINGQFVNFLVDTGASVVAISSRTAQSLGINYLAGKLGTVQTAQGVTESYFLNLAEVTVGGIRVPNVEAAIIMGNYPVEILLGMSFLKAVKMEEHNGVLMLTQ
ncbi:MAG: retropepsin-like aspartic protease family protein [Pseudomonadales bacterium]